MLTLGSKPFASASGLTLAAAALYWLATTDLVGSLVLTAAAIALAMVAAAVLRGTGPADAYSYVPDDLAHVGAAPRPTVVPFVAALGLGCLMLGLALGPAGTVVGVLILALCAMVWFTESWREHPSYEAALSTRVSDSLALPFGLPLLLVGLIGFVGVMVSRTLLAVSATAAWVIALVVAVAILLVVLLLASRRRVSRSTTALLIGVALVVIVALGVYGLARGERSTEEGAVGHRVAAEAA